MRTIFKVSHTPNNLNRAFSLVWHKTINIFAIFCFNNLTIHTGNKKIVRYRMQMVAITTHIFAHN